MRKVAARLERRIRVPVEPIKRVSVVEQAISKIYDLILSQNLKENDKIGRASCRERV